MEREAEQIEDVCRTVWTKRVPPGTELVNPTQFVSVLSDCLRKLGISPPPSQWYYLAFRNFDLDSDGWINYQDVLELNSVRDVKDLIGSL